MRIPFRISGRRTDWTSAARLVPDIIQAQRRKSRGEPLAAPFIYKYYLGILAQGAQPEGSIERQDHDGRGRNRA
jgi:hypothetical protein